MRGSTHLEIVEALSSLFGGTGISVPEMLTKELLKQVYRKRIFDCHPDRSKSLGRVERKQASRTATLNNAYSLLNRLTAKGEFDTTKLHLNPKMGLAMTTTKKRSAPKRTAGVKPRFSNPPVAESNSRPPEFEYRAVMMPFWEGSIPMRRLRFGRFLYYKGVISWDTLVDGLMWQAQQRPVLGRVLLAKAYISREELQFILAHRKQNEFVGACAVRLGLISSLQLEHAIAQQQKQRRPLGDYFIRRGLLTHDTLRRYLNRHDMHNQRYDSSSTLGGSRRFGRASTLGAKVNSPSS